jgi:peptidoglycan/xylan/chitin deacetylase (PgdA/CDA1 family)
MKLIHLGAIVTGILIVIGIAIVAPVFTLSSNSGPRSTVMLSFSVTGESDTAQWCKDLSSVLEKYDIKASVFFSGTVAENSAECVTVFENSIDIGSQTYSYVKLPSIQDYSIQLEEVRKGKQSVDDAGSLQSKLFKAPYGLTDQNIYSILSRSEILADFSYDDHYNKYHESQFILFNASVFNGIDHSPEFFINLGEEKSPVIIWFDDKVPINQIDTFISRLKVEEIHFVNASELAGIELTIREVYN